MTSITAGGARRLPTPKSSDIPWRVSGSIRFSIATVWANARSARNARLLGELSDDALKDIGIGRHQLRDPVWLAQALPHQTKQRR